MSPARRFPFGHEPAAARVPAEPPSTETALLVGFAAPARVLPFSAAPPAHLPARTPTRRTVRAWMIVAVAVLVVLDAGLLFLVVRGMS